MGSNVGAVFDAILMRYAAASTSIQSVQAWNDRDGAYGKINRPNNPRPGYHVLKLMNEYFYGSRVYTKTSSANTIEILAVKDSIQKSLLLINRSGSDQEVIVSFSNWNYPEVEYAAHHIKHEYETSAGALNDTFMVVNIPSESVVMYIFDTRGLSPVETNMEKSVDFRVFPNPVNNNNIYLHLSGFEPKQDIEVKLNDLSGLIVMSKKIYASEYNEMITLETQGKISPGVYLITLSNEQYKINQKVLIF
ncbi:MAG: T9SS type A sorting domain-containing protein [Bacteroidales bacterium]|nr:T9SS type A sorting domain-containing protein [Bacteroidales bacterium]